MRQRTKIGERVELRAANGLVIATCIPATMGPYAGRADFSVVGKDEKVVRVTSWKLAPLVKLPAWKKEANAWGEWATTYASYGPMAPGVWCAWVGKDGGEWRTGHASAAEARTACESRLRELGYKVAKAKKAPRLSAEARAARAPRPPEELVGAFQDRIHDTSGALIAAKSVRTWKGGES